MANGLATFWQSLCALLEEFWPLLVEATWQTLYMVLISTAIAYILGLPLGILVVITADDSICPNKPVNRVLGWIVNIGRSIPFIILLVALLPFTRMVVGTSIGPTATIVPLTIAATPFVARMVEQSLVEIEGGLVEMAQAMGATVWQVIFKVLLPESLPSMIRGFSITFISLIGYSAMAGAVGGGGLGDLAIRYGYYRYQSDVMVLTIVLLVFIVQLIQMIGDGISRRVDKRNIR